MVVPCLILIGHEGSAWSSVCSLRNFESHRNNVKIFATADDECERTSGRAGRGEKEFMDSIAVCPSASQGPSCRSNSMAIECDPEVKVNVDVRNCPEPAATQADDTFDLRLNILRGLQATFFASNAVAILPTNDVPSQPRSTFTSPRAPVTYRSRDWTFATFR